MQEVATFSFDIFLLNDRDRNVDPGTPTDDEVLSLFKTLSKLQTMKISGSDRIAKLVLYTASPLPCFATLRNLELYFPWHEVLDKYDAFDPVELLGRLAKLTALGSLHYSISPRQPPAYINYLGVAFPPMPFLENIRTLHLGGSVCGAPTLGVLALQLPSLTKISFDSSGRDDSSQPIFDFLDHFPNPERVDSLELNLNDPECESEANNLMDALDNYPNLSSLSLSNLALDPIYHYFSCLPLRHLTLGRDNADLSIEPLSMLVSGSTKIKTLETLTLHNFVTRKGSPIPRHIPMARLNMKFATRYGWRFAEWTREFDVGGLDALRTLGESEGIKVTGNAFEAIDIDIEWMHELGAHERERRELKYDSDDEEDDGNEFGEHRNGSSALPLVSLSFATCPLFSH